MKKMKKMNEELTMNKKEEKNFFFNEKKNLIKIKFFKKYKFKKKHKETRIHTHN